MKSKQAPPSPTQNSKTVLDQAFDWLIQLNEHPNDSQLEQQLSDWLAQSERHRQAWEKAQKTWQFTSQLNNELTIAHTKRPPIKTQRTFKWTVAALAACVFYFAFPTLKLYVTADFQTQTGQIQEHTLADGSSVFLSAESAIATDFQAEHRAVKLLQGEAFFDVKPDPIRPFRVELDDLSIVVSGTTFNVRESASTYAITVQSGYVHVTYDEEPTSVELTKGQRLTIKRQTGAKRLKNIAPQDVAAWREGLLFAQENTLAETIEILQRYFPGQIVLTNQQRAQQEITGVYNLNRPKQALEGMIAPFKGKIHQFSSLVTVVTL